MQLDHDQLHRLLAVLEQSDIQEFKLEGDDFRLEVRRNLPVAAPPPAPAAAAIQAVPAPAPTPSGAPSPSTPPPTAAVRADLVDITAPMVGTFYRAATPDDPPFVELGSRIAVGQPVCILEAMKLMNELEAEVSGEVVEILVENGTPVEYGQVLVRVKPA
ncbi:acetyl-CoA carboxylase biotin carboxyl carrier protein [Synechococcus sp. Tobar12-5m-g]|jgi:acetyl-CoA carboxylase biotin carboxyl carrier protein|uniref:acetyl-CoA carboxylase biotin carboxyl carrier protein n=1 Tax=unclassified Synechococcus TaxID=2626047 RepID=UPI0020CE9E54|nr:MULTISPECIES: acetyl-CoA carboxylase biotin carboxyl carrier protein [unclassified Synechococcus]MCP9772385.1 acetyl-CoA carboxylase biotin carboxyl carrier protein [Synechococcus sp. Tobar12-5m-g]MCP9873972.1 acetyl-CoA carboxylase biotin carboxyl carrier protein [Synechococcus sp. Cruz CV-v-12]